MEWLRTEHPIWIWSEGYQNNSSWNQLRIFFYISSYIQISVACHGFTLDTHQHISYLCQYNNRINICRGMLFSTRWVPVLFTYSKVFISTKFTCMVAKWQCRWYNNYNNKCGVVTPEAFARDVVQVSLISVYPSQGTVSHGFILEKGIYYKHAHFQERWCLN